MEESTQGIITRDSARGLVTGKGNRTSLLYGLVMALEWEMAQRALSLDQRKGPPHGGIARGCVMGDSVQDFVMGNIVLGLLKRECTGP